MCGITGVFLTAASISGNSIQSSVAIQHKESLKTVVMRMADSLSHRGPDDSGAWVDEQAGISLGHRRLAIVDLTPSGHQPMLSSSGRFVVGFNGEIYNHLALRSELEQIKCGTSSGKKIWNWQGHSDTETLLAGFEVWGVETTLSKAVGMFAIALWDKQDRTLVLARDRLGEKPLYYGWVNGALVFGSELKALKAYPGFDNPICRQALTQYLRFMYVPAPRSIYQGIYKLEPGCLLKVHGQPPLHAPTQPLRPEQKNEHLHGSLLLSRWWSLANVVRSGASKPLINEAEALSSLECCLNEAVKQQSMADVPLGAFLSGGVDSSSIVALMQQQNSRPIKTFTVGFDEAGFDESPFARSVAKHLGTDHHEMRVNEKMAREVIPSLAWMYDEPFADSSQIPTYLICRSARQHVTVALSGDAGDELFGGYNRYFWGPRIWNKLNFLPLGARKLIGSALATVPIEGWNALGAPFFGQGEGVSRLGDKVHRLAERLSHVNNMDSLYFSLVSEWHDPGSLVIAEDFTLATEPASLVNDPLPCTDMEQPLPMMYRDSMTYLTDDILCKVDRAAMACSLETRVPFLDHRVVELAWKLPLEMKVRGNIGKWALRQVLYKYVPKELIDRPKAGFAIPIGQWLRGPLRDWAENLINEERLKSEGYLRPSPIRQAWTEHLDGRRNHTSKLWAVLMFQAWLENNR